MNLNNRVKRLLRQAAELGRRGAQIRASRQQRETARQEELNPSDPWLVRFWPVAERFQELVESALDLVTDEEFERVNEGLKLHAEYHRDSEGWRRGDWGGSPRCWSHGVLDSGFSILPPDLSVEVVYRLLVIRLTERARLNDIDLVCVKCGLQLPRDKQAPWYPEVQIGFFACCPHCGGEQMEYAHCVGSRHYPWKDSPGFVGRSSGRRIEIFEMASPSPSTGKGK
jgi:hypothetical protein